MSEARVYETPEGVSLGPLDLIADGKARGFVLQMRAGRFHGFAVRRSSEVHGYVDRCPHAGLPLAQQLDEYMTADGSFVSCAWHGALFQPETGDCVAGPCFGQRLARWPLAVIDGKILTA